MNNFPWGWLVAVNSKGLRLTSDTKPGSPVLIPVRDEVLKIGRDLSCDIIVNESMFIESGDEDLKIGKVSRVQFEIKKVDNLVVVIDRSMNGTYVNGIKVGKDKEQILDQGDVVAILQSNFNVFFFISELRLRQSYPIRVIEKYLVGSVLGEGASAVVREGIVRTSEERVALKMIKKEKWPSKYSRPEVMCREVDISSQLNHPCIIKVKDVFDEEEMLVIVMEYASGGELFYQVVKESNNGAMVEAKAKFRFYQISHAIAYLHRNKVCHRDLKLENILMMNSSPGCLLKITDFGLSKQYSSIDVLETFVGAPVYMAPEIISMSGGFGDAPAYTEKSDCWSLGVVLYILLSGCQPFKDTNNLGLQAMLMSGNYVPMRGGRWGSVSDDAKNLVASLLSVDPLKRLEAAKILIHPWFKNDESIVSQAKQVMGLVQESMLTDSGRGTMEDSEINLESKRKREVPGDVYKVRIG